MKTALYTLVLLVTLSLMSCTATQNQESSGEYLDDSVITTKIKSLLAKDDLLKSFQISVETRKGEVQLSGFVDSELELARAGELVSTVKGVDSVSNDLIVK